MKFKEVETIFRSEKYYRNLVKLHFLEKGSSENLGVQNNTHGNSNEKNIFYKMHDKEYIEAKSYIEAIDKLDLSVRERTVYNLRYRHKMSVERIAREINYSIATIWNDLNVIKNKFIKIIEIR